jgi:hypothetical protein
MNVTESFSIKNLYVSNFIYPSRYPVSGTAVLSFWVQVDCCLARQHLGSVPIRGRAVWRKRSESGSERVALLLTVIVQLSILEVLKCV